MYPTYTFKVNLLNRTSIYGNSQPDVSVSNVLQQAQYATVYLEEVDHPLKHGDTFELRGEKALRVKKKMESGQLAFGVELFPVVTTDSLAMGNAADATVGGSVLVEGSSDVSSYGVVWSLKENPTIADNVAEVDDASFTGSFSKHISSLPIEEDVHFRVYATNDSGTSYGSDLTGHSVLCLIKGTLITLPNGSKKKIEDVRYEDELLVWNFDTAKLDQAKPVWIVEPFMANQYSLVKFSDGTELGTVADGKGHRIFNVEKGMFTYMMTDETPIGTTTFNEDGQLVTVVSKEVVEETKTFYNVITDRHMNLFANTILTSTGLNNIYPIDNMRFVKDERKPRAHEEFEVTESLFNGLRLAEQPQSYHNLHGKIDRMVSRQAK